MSFDSPDLFYDVVKNYWGLLMAYCYVLVYQNGVNTQDLRKDVKLNIAKYLHKCSNDWPLSKLLSEYIDYFFCDFADSAADYDSETEI